MSEFEAQITGNSRSIAKMRNEKAAHFSLKMTGGMTCAKASWVSSVRFDSGIGEQPLIDDKSDVIRAEPEPVRN